MNTVDEFCALLRAEANGQSRLHLEAIWRVFLKWRPDLATAGNKRTELARWIELASQTSAFALPRSKGLFDRSAVPPLPEWIAFPVTRVETQSFDHRAYPWFPTMAFIAALPRLVNSEDALAINRFLVNNRTPALVPMKERSYEIFGDEKRLDAVLDGTLGSSLTMEALNCYIPSFVPVHRTGNLLSRRVLIVENEAAFDSFCRWNKQHSTWHTVVFGRGIEVWKVTPFLCETWPVETTLEYFGDFDRAGVCIAFRLSQQLDKHGRRLRPLLPAYRFLSTQTARADSKEHSTDWPQAINWLEDSDVITAANKAFIANLRVAQEAFGWNRLSLLNTTDL